MRSIVLAVGLAGILLALQYRLWFAKSGVASTVKLRNEIKTLDATNQELLKENEALQREIISLQKGDVLIENRARYDLGMVKDGEVFYQILD